MRQQRSNSTFQSTSTTPTTRTDGSLWRFSDSLHRQSYASITTTQSEAKDSVREHDEPSVVVRRHDHTDDADNAQAQAIDVLIERTVELLKAAHDSLDVVVEARDHLARFGASEDRIVAGGIDDTHQAIERSCRDSDRLVLEAERCRMPSDLQLYDDDDDDDIQNERAATSVFSMSPDSSFSRTTTSSTPPSSVLSQNARFFPESLSGSPPEAKPTTTSKASLWPSSPTGPPRRVSAHHRRTSTAVTLNAALSQTVASDASRVTAAGDVSRGAPQGHQGSDLLRERLKTTLSAKAGPSAASADNKSNPSVPPAKSSTSGGGGSSWWWR